MDNKSYNTKQRSQLLDYLANHKEKCFSAKELIKNEEIKLGEATIYRTLAKFVGDGTVKKFISPGSDGALYQYNSDTDECSSHFHLKCIACGELIHMECAMMQEITDHVRLHHGFVIDNSKSVLYGLCTICSEKEIS